MEENRAEKKPVSIRLSAFTQERFQKTLESYKNSADDRRDQQENALIRILEIAESEVVRVTHPELEKSLIAVEETIATLIKQINGIATGQDGRIAALQENLNATIEEKQETQEKAQKAISEAQEKIQEANEVIKKAEEDSRIAQAEAKAQIDAMQQEMEVKIQQMQNDLEQANRECEDARALAEEKSSSNNLLLKQMASMEADVNAYKKLLDDHKKLQTEHAELSSQNEQDKIQARFDLEKAVTAKEHELRDLYEGKLNRLDEAHQKLQADHAALLARVDQDRIQAELNQEKAVMAKERELRDLYENRLRQADKESARLQATIDQLKETTK